MVRRVLQLSLQADPLNLLDGGDVGGQQIFVRKVARYIQFQGYGTDVVTVRRSPEAPVRFSLGHLGQVLRMDLPLVPVSDEGWAASAPELAARALALIRQEGRAYQMIHSHYWISGLVAEQLAAELGIPWIHTPYKLAQWVARTGDVISPVRAAAERKILNQADAVVVSYLGEGDLIRRLSPDVTIYVVPPGVEPTQFFSRDAGPVLKRLNLPRRPAIYVGRLAAGRGLEGLLSTLGEIRLPDEFRFLVVGGNSGEVEQGRPQDARLKALRDRLGPHVEFLGAMPHRAVAPFLAASSVMAAPNQGPTLGMAVLEGMASGLPVVGTAVTGIQDWIADGTDGVVVAPGRLDLMAEALLRLWSDTARARRMGTAGQNRIHRHYTGEKMGSQLARVYREVMGHERHSAGSGY
ncbi:MAG: glycosyltransferase [Thermaerobacter sp.]|nr:glycosyltransferase [Thermaerobacter sp.]